MTWVAAGIATAEAAADAAAIAEAAGTAEAGVTAAEGITAASELASAAPEVATVAPEVATVAPEVGGAAAPSAAPSLGANYTGSILGGGPETLSASGSSAGLGQGASGAGLGQGSSAATGNAFLNEVPNAAQASLAQTQALPYALNGGAASQQAFLSGNALSATDAASSGSDFMNGLKSVGNYASAHPFQAGAVGYGLLSATGALNPKQQTFQQSGITFKNPYTISPNFQGTHPNPSQYQYAAHYADGGLGTVEEMSRENATGSNQMFPQANLSGLTGMNTYQNPTNTPMSSNVIGPTDTPTDPYTGAMRFAGGGIADVPRFKTGGMDIYDASQRFASMYDSPVAPAEKGDAGIFKDDSPTTRYLQAFPAAQAKLNAINKRAYVNTPQYKTPTSMSQLGGLNFTTPGQKPDNSTDNTESVLAANGGIMGYSLGGYAHGGNPRLLRGPGDGVSDSIPATIADRQPARLADGEFVVPARIVSELGNGSTEAGAKRLHEMMNNVQKARSKTVGKGNIAVDSKAYKAIPKK